MINTSGVSLDCLVSELERVGEFFDYDIDFVIVFGSFASGDFDDESDFDVVVVSDDFEGEGELERRGNFLAEWDFDNYPDLDVVTLTPGEFREALDDRNWLIEEVVEDGVVFDL